MTFDRSTAINGVLVGFRQSDATDLTYTGRLSLTENDLYYNSYSVIMLGVVLIVDDTGTVTKVTPSNNPYSDVLYEGNTLQMVICTTETTYGTKQSVTRAATDGEDTSKTSVDIANLEPRDQFAMQALVAILRGLDRPECYDDANILVVCQAAYRWAQGMMCACADARYRNASSSSGGTEEETKKVTIDTNSLGTNVEKLLYNISATLENQKLQDKTQYNEVKKEGLKVRGSDAEDALPVVVAGSDASSAKPVNVKLTDGAKVEISKMPDSTNVKVTEMPSVNISGTPSVNVANSPSVSISGTPSVSVSNSPSVAVSNTVQVSGTVSVNNFPSNSDFNE